MHIPNGFLSDPVCAVSTATSLAALGVGFARARQTDHSGSAALMAATGAGDRPLSGRRVMAGGLIAAIAVAGLLAPWASSAPDGLDRVAQDLQIASLATSSWALAPEYAAPGVAWPALAVALAGIAGAFFVFASSYTVGRTALVKVRKH